MDKALITGLAIGVGIVGYKIGVYTSIIYKIKNEKKQKIVNLGTISEYKARLEKEKAQ
jgi:hypothetical protein